MHSFIDKWRRLPRIAYIFGVSNFVIAAGAFVMPFLTLMLTKKLGMSTLEAAFYVNIVFVAYVPATILGGWLTDRIGRKTVYIGAICLEILATACAGFYANQFELIYFLFAIAFMNGMVSPVMQAWQADYSTPENRQMVFGTSYFGWNLGFAIGPAVAGLLFNNHFQLMFWGDAFTTFCAMVLILFLLPHEKPEQTETESPEREAEKAHEGGMWSLLLSRPRLLLFALVGYFLNLIYGQMAFSVPIHLDATFGADGPAIFGQLWMVNALMVVVFTPFVAGLSGRYSTYFNIAIAAVCYGIGFSLLGSTNSFMLLSMSIAVFTFGEVMSATNSQAHIANESPKNFRGRMSGTLNLLIGAGYGMSPLLSGLFIDKWGIEMIWPTVFGIGMVCAVAILLIRPKSVVAAS
ncbi:MFS transporter [Maritalea porphyrae]|uniref:MFS transporter n=1 Tax=Maritalea porphyrae TaxID=880732 RepID=UPI0022B07BF7|nr:MFS transporter [Maritalea porphyrae]MCZ4272616.1 MFS transporter [Maritalea porphyrae]